MDRPAYIVDAVPTKNLPGGLKPGRTYEVDTRSEYVRSLLEHGHLRLADPAVELGEAEPDGSEPESEAGDAAD